MARARLHGRIARMAHVGLVSALYRMPASEWSGGQDERRVRLKHALRRLEAAYGPDHVQTRIAAYEPCSPEESVLKRILLDHVSVAR